VSVPSALFFRPSKPVASVKIFLGCAEAIDHSEPRLVDSIRVEAIAVAVMLFFFDLSPTLV
jgi:hypothetical protein